MSEKRTTITDIAKRLNVSMNTVNKALYGKKGVGEELRAKIQATAKAMNYQANRVAQSMARNPVLIGVLATREWEIVTDDFRKGIQRALDRLRDYNIHGKFYPVSSRNCRVDIEAQLARAVADGVNAIVCNHVELESCDARMLAEKSIPFAFLGTDVLLPQRLTSVYSNGEMAGRLAAELLGGMLPAGGRIAVVTGSREYRDCEDKVQGFLSSAADFGLEVAGIYEHFDLPEQAARLVDQAVEAHPGLCGIYATTANSPEICRRIVELGLQDRLKIIATDIYGEIRQYLRDGIIKAALYQDCIREGEKIIELIYSHLCEGKKISSQVLIPPVIVLRNNLELF